MGGQKKKTNATMVGLKNGRTLKWMDRTKGHTEARVDGQKKRYIWVDEQKNGETDS